MTACSKVITDADRAAAATAALRREPASLVLTDGQRAAITRPSHLFSHPTKSGVPMNLSQYRKSIAALIGGLGTWWAASYSNGIDGSEQGALLVLLASVVAVWGVANEEG